MIHGRFAWIGHAGVAKLLLANDRSHFVTGSEFLWDAGLFDSLASAVHNGLPCPNVDSPRRW